MRPAEGDHPGLRQHRVTVLHDRLAVLARDHWQSDVVQDRLAAIVEVGGRALDAAAGNPTLLDGGARVDASEVDVTNLGHQHLALDEALEPLVGLAVGLGAGPLSGLALGTGLRRLEGGEEGARLRGDRLFLAPPSLLGPTESPLLFGLCLRPLLFGLGELLCVDLFPPRFREVEIDPQPIGVANQLRERLLALRTEREGPLVVQFADHNLEHREDLLLGGVPATLLGLELIPDGDQHVHGGGLRLCVVDDAAALPAEDRLDGRNDGLRQDLLLRNHDHLPSFLEIFPRSQTMIYLQSPSLVGHPTKECRHHRWKIEGKMQCTN